MQPFNPDAFFATLGTTGPQLTTGIKGDWTGLYKRFFRSPNFSGWFNARYKEVTQKLQVLHDEALSDAVSMPAYCSGRQSAQASTIQRMSQTWKSPEIFHV